MALRNPDAIIAGRDGLYLSWVDDDTVQVGIGQCILPNGVVVRLESTLNLTFTSLDTGARTVGVDYYVYAVNGGFIISASASAPSGYTISNSRLLGYFHNGKDYAGGGADGAIFQYSVCSNDLIIPATPYVAHPHLAAGIPLPGMVKCGPFAIGIYAASRNDATASSGGSGVVPRSQYGVVPWASIQGFEATAVLAACGCRLPTLFEWWMAAMWRPGYATVALQNGNTAYGSSSDDTYLAAPGALTSGLAGAGAGLLGAGLYKYKVTLVNATGETNGGTANAGTTVADPGTDGKIALSAIPTGAAGTTARKIYRTVAGGSTYKLLATIADNTTTTYTDNIADASLGATEPGFNTTGAQQGAADPTVAGRTLVGTGPRTTQYATAAGRSWYSPVGCADMVGNIWEWAAFLAAGLYSGAGYGGSKDWGMGDGDKVYNVDSYAYQPQAGGWVTGLPAMALLGGSWSYALSSGVRAVILNYAPGNSHTDFGFRASR